MMNKS